MRALLLNKKVQVLLNAGFGVVLLVVAFFSARHFMRSGWPLHHADPLLVGASALLFFCAYAFKAWGWQRLFAKHERPSSQSLAFADDTPATIIVRFTAAGSTTPSGSRSSSASRHARRSLAPSGLSLLVLGLLDNAP